MSLLDRLSEKNTWEAFYLYKTSLACPKPFAGELRDFIDREGYLPVCEAIRRGDPFPLPKKAVISKADSQKKRTVYTYPPAENTVLKLLTYLLLRQYDGVFAPGLWSFRPGRTAKDALRRLTAVPGIRQMTAYKADISNYFNSIPVDRLVEELRAVLGEDEPLYGFLRSLLLQPLVLEKGAAVPEEKGAMAGTPLSAFYANLYLRELDWQFAREGIPYARYSDDVILFAADPGEARALAERVRAYLLEAGLSLNPDKEQLTAPEEGWTYLGFSVRGGSVGIAPATVKKLKAKMRRKARALRRWQTRNGLAPEKAAAAFWRIFRRKLLESPADNELSWSRWFFPVINSPDSLREIDACAQECLRWLLTGTRTKARFNARYGDLKALGYQTLVHEYYAYRKKAAETERQDGSGDPPAG